MKEDIIAFKPKSIMINAHVWTPNLNILGLHLKGGCMKLPIKVKC